MRAFTVRCPTCGGNLDVADAATSITCPYCGNAARIQSRSRILQVPHRLPPRQDGQPVPVARQRLGRILAIPIVIVAACVVIPLVVAARRDHALRAVAGPDRDRLWWSGASPVVTDVDGDGHADLIGYSRYILADDRTHLAAFSGVTGAKLWESPPLGKYIDVYAGLVAAAGDRVLLATAAGALRSYDRKTGTAGWEIALGEKVKHLCAADQPTAIVVDTADDRWHLIDLADGRQRAAPPLAEPDDGSKRRGFQVIAACQPIDSNERESMPGLIVHDARDGLPHVDGMYVERVVRRGAGPWIAIGYKSPGTGVPMVAAIADDGSTRWSAAVPAVDPLTARAEETLVTVTADTVVAEYEPQSSSAPPHLTAFALADGRRLWDTTVAYDRTISMTGLVVAGRHVVLSSQGHLQAFDLATGAPAFRIGQL